ncbi:MAG: hypothetical protein ACX93N_01995 [Pseudohaliea sp.]
MKATLLILLVVVLALAPLWHFRPSPRQRSQAALRERAALAGLYVEFRDLPLPRSRRERLPASERQVLYYGLRLPPSRGAARRARAWWRERGGWRASEGRDGPPAAVASLPEWALAASIDEASCGVYWHESGGPEGVDAIADALAAWRDAEAGSPRGASLDP